MSNNISSAEGHVLQLKALSEILSREQEIFSQYLEILSSQHKCLIENNFEAFQLGINKIDSLSAEAAKLEKRRRDILTSLTTDGEMRVSYNLKIIIQDLKGLNFETLELLKDQIIGVHKKIMARRRRNGILIAESASVLRKTIDPGWNSEYSETANIKSNIETGSVLC